MTTRLGVMGCGQLGQMLGRAALKLGIPVSFLQVDENPVVHGLGPVFSEGQLDEFFANVDYVTIERESIPDVLLERVSQQSRLAPSYDSLMALRVRHKQKALFDRVQIPTAPWTYVENAQALPAALATFNGERVRAKRVLGGYDGGGQWVLDADAAESVDIPAEAFPLILEAEIAVDYEISVLLARSRDGNIIYYPINRNLMHRGVLVWSFVPAQIDMAMADQARQFAADLAAAIDYVGVLAMEFFVSQGQLLVNEIAPRVHNTGHWTIEGASCDQFEQHVRAVCGLPLRAPKPVPAAGMCNILGDNFPLRLPTQTVGMYLHGYGKSLRPGRKMGHLTLTGSSVDDVTKAAQDIGINNDILAELLLK